MLLVSVLEVIVQKHVFEYLSVLLCFCMGTFSSNCGLEVSNLPVPRTNRSRSHKQLFD